MARDILKIFVSSSESELQDEREIVIDTIKEMGYQAFASENRTASSRSIEEEYKEEVRLSQIYVGIVGGVYSEPTIIEFETAKENKIPTLVFKKKSDNPDPRVGEFLTRIKNSTTGITIKTFDHVIGVRNELRNAIVYLVSREFRNPTGYDKRAITENIKTHAEATKLGEATIDEVVIPSEISRGNGAIIYVKVSGRARYAFLDLLLVDPEGLQRWYPNADDEDSMSDKGKLMFDGTYEGRWGFISSMDWKTGSYIALLGYTRTLTTCLLLIED